VLTGVLGVLTRVLLRAHRLLPRAPIRRSLFAVSAPWERGRPGPARPVGRTSTDRQIRFTFAHDRKCNRYLPMSQRRGVILSFYSTIWGGTAHGASAFALVADSDAWRHHNQTQEYGLARAAASRAPRLGVSRELRRLEEPPHQPRSPTGPTGTRIYTNTPVCFCLRVCLYIYIYVYISIHTHTHTHTSKQSRPMQVRPGTAWTVLRGGTQGGGVLGVLCASC
jgi:hypothetical protein